MKISRAYRPLRTEYFATSNRDETSGITIAYTDHVPDERIDSHALDYQDACKGFFGGSYHYVIKPSGAVEIGRDPRTYTSRGNQVLSEFNIMIGIVGGRNEVGDRVTTITPAQREAVEELMQAIVDCLQVSLTIDDYVEDKANRDQQHADELADERQEAALDRLEAISGN